MGFVGNYAPCGLSPQTDGMPVILKSGAGGFSGAVSKIIYLYTSGIKPEIPDRMLKISHYHLFIVLFT